MMKSLLKNIQRRIKIMLLIEFDRHSSSQYKEMLHSMIDPVAKSSFGATTFETFRQWIRHNHKYEEVIEINL